MDIGYPALLVKISNGFDCTYMVETERKNMFVERKHRVGSCVAKFSYNPLKAQV
jgi:hypothetical protein